MSNQTQSLLETTLLPPFSDEQQVLLKSLGTAMTQAGYNHNDVTTLLGLSPSQYPRRRNVALQRQRIIPGDAVGTLAELFVLGVWVDEPALQKALPGVDLAGLADMGILEINDGQASSPISIIPYADLLIACDLYEMGSFAHEFVPAVTPSSHTVMSAIPRAKVGATIDIGTGSGLLALVMAAQSHSVVGTDINERALNFLRIGAALNGLDNIDVALGSLLEPVQDQQFELIVSNPPFVISPEVCISMHEHGGMQGDGISQQLIASVGDHLCEGGTAVMLCNWAHDGDDWSVPVLEWAKDSGCDVVAYVMSSVDAVGYVELWHPQGGFRPVGNKVEEEVPVELWFSYLKELGISHVATGLIYLRRRTTGIPNWSYFGVTSASPGEQFGDNVTQVIESIGFLYSLQNEEDILDYAYLPVDMQQVEVRFRASDGATITALGASWPNGIGTSVTCSPEQQSLIDRCDGTTTLKFLVDELGLGDDTLSFVKEMLMAGLLKPIISVD